MSQCTHPNAELVPASYDLTARRCPDCGYVDIVHGDEMPADAPSMPQEARQLKLQGLDRGRQSNRVRTSEDDVQTEIVKHLRLKGYLVLVTSHRRKGVVCPTCHNWFRPSGGTGCSKAIPDLLVRDPRWRPHTWVGLECKGPQTAVSAEQKALADGSHIRIVRSIADAENAIKEATG